MGEWLGDRFKLNRFVLRDRRHEILKIDGTGRVTTKVFNGRVVIDDAPIELVNQIIPEPLPISGRVSLDLETKGHLTAPEGQGRSR